jgi:hypothetical protein
MYLGWLLLTALLASCRDVTAGPSPGNGDAQATCKAAADDWFKKKYPVAAEQNPMGSGKAAYTSHFSSTKSNCFMEVVETAHIPKDGATDTLDSEIHYLIDVMAGQEIGQLVIQSNRTAPLWCEVAEAKCWNATEWNALVGAYMKD